MFGDWDYVSDRLLIVLNGIEMRDRLCKLAPLVELLIVLNGIEMGACLLRLAPLRNF